MNYLGFSLLDLQLCHLFHLKLYHLFVPCFLQEPLNLLEVAIYGGQFYYPKGLLPNLCVWLPFEAGSLT